MKGETSFLTIASLYVPTVLLLCLLFQECVFLLILVGLFPALCLANQYDSR